MCGGIEQGGGGREGMYVFEGCDECISVPDRVWRYWGGGGGLM